MFLSPYRMSCVALAKASWDTIYQSNVFSNPGHSVSSYLYVHTRGESFVKLPENVIECLYECVDEKFIKNLIN